MNALPPRDELACAYLDGEATPDERAAVEADAALMTRVEELRAVRRALAVPVPVRSTAEIDAAISAALAAVPDADDQGGTPAPVPLRAGPRRGRIAVAVLGAAAAAAVVVGIVTLRPSDNSTQSAGRGAAATDKSEAAGGGDLAATTAGAATTTAGAAGAGATIAANAPAVATTATASAAGGATTAASGTGLPALGPIDDAGGLRTALGTAAPSGLSAVSASAADSGCSVPDARLAASVVWQGTAAYVFVDQGNVGHIVSQSTCATLATVPLS